MVEITCCGLLAQIAEPYVACLYFRIFMFKLRASLSFIVSCAFCGVLARQVCDVTLAVVAGESAVRTWWAKK